MGYSSNKIRSGVVVICKGSDGIVIEYELKCNFQTTNNQAKYKALIVDLKLAKKFIVKVVTTTSDS